MRRVARTIPALAAAAFALYAGGEAGASGSIVTTGSTIASGSAPAAGSVTIDRCARGTAVPALPDIEPLGAVGALTGTLPAFAGGGSGAGGAFTATANTTLPPGTYDFTTFTVNPGIVVTCLGAVTIQTTGATTLNGALISTVPSAPITLHCGGDLSINVSVVSANTPSARLETQGVSSPISVDVAGSISLSSIVAGRGATILVNDGSLDLTAQGGMNFYASAVVNASSVIQSNRGDVTVRCGLDLFTGSAFVNAFAGSILMQSFGGDVALGGAANAGSIVAIGGGARIEAANAATASRGAAEAHGGSLVFLALGGSMTIQNAWSFDSYGAPLTVGASAGIAVLDTAGIRGHGTSVVAVTAHGGTLRLGDLGSAQAPEIVQLSSGPLDVRASGDIVMHGRSRISTPSGDVTIESVAGSFRQDGDTSVNATGGVLDARAAGALTAVRNVSTGASKPSVTGGSVLLRAGAGGVVLDVDQVAADTGTCTVASGGPVTVAGPVTSADDLTIRSIEGGVAMLGQTLTTQAAVGVRSGDIVVESYAGGRGAIDATNATIRSGNHPAASGDVTLEVFLAGSGHVDGFLLPKSVAIRLDPVDPAKSRLTAAGFLDTGAFLPSLAGPGTLSVGPFDTAVDLVADAKGKLRFADESVDLQVVPGKSGSSKAKFTLRRTGDFGALAGPTGAGPLTIRFSNASVTCESTVVLKGGKFALGKSRGALVSPSLFPLTCVAVLTGNKLDDVSAKLGFATDGTTPGTAPDVTVSFGDRFRATIPATAFGALPGERFVARNPLPGVLSVTLDYRHETIAFVARDVDLGAFAAGPSAPVTIGVSLGTDARGVKVRLVRKGLTIRY